ncbi:MAG: hypothetical protein FWH38_03255 [Treponema sp.]|nr:hypothetical protein [Treponema sp.]
MKKLFILLFAIALSLPLYSQEEPVPEEDSAPAEPEKKRADFSRQYFELGYNAGLGIDNDFIGIRDIFKKNIVIDLNSIGDKVGSNGVNINAGLFFDFILNFNMGGNWGFGFFSGADGHIHGNLPQSVFTLMTQGNISLPSHSSSGTISAYGGIFANAGLSGFAKFGKLTVGAKPAFFAPLIYIPGKPGITYFLNAEDQLSIGAQGEIQIYSPFFASSGGVGLGADISLEGEYALFPFLDVGGSLDKIPLGRANLKYGKRYTMEEFSLDVENPLKGEEYEFPEPKFKDEDFTSSYKVSRPFRFDVYARYKPFKSELLVVRPNLGFTANATESVAFFNAGLLAQLNLMNMFKVYLGTGREEAIWKHRLGFALNFRAFELDIEAALQSQNFGGAFRVEGFGINLGMYFGY